VHPPTPADAILTLGSFETHAALHAAALWKRGLAPTIVMSGGVAHRGWEHTEAHVFAALAIGAGVPGEAILREERAQNTGENFTCGRTLMAQAGIVPRRLIVVAKPYMTRRGFATGRKVWPEVELAMQCEDIGAAEYLAREADPERTMQALVGDLHRVAVYPALGFQIEQEMPVEVVEALHRLVAAGYGARLVPGRPIPGSPPRRP
jgi:uncharacterized SAM-binding protein YcdF (DUF218 family)